MLTRQANISATNNIMLLCSNIMNFPQDMMPALPESLPLVKGCERSLSSLANTHKAGGTSLSGSSL